MRIYNIQKNTTSIIVGTANSTIEHSITVSSSAGQMQMYSKNSATGNRGIWLPAHGTAAGKDLIVVDSDNEAMYEGSAAYLKSNRGTNRPTSANDLHSTITNRRVEALLATSSMTTGKPPTDAHILHFNWDNTGGWDAQLAVGNNGANSQIFYRAQNAGTWQAWKTVSTASFSLSGTTLTITT